MTVVVGSTKIQIQDDGKWNSSEERISFIDKRLNTICKITGFREGPTFSAELDFGNLGSKTAKIGEKYGIYHLI